VSNKEQSRRTQQLPWTAKLGIASSRVRDTSHVPEGSPSVSAIAESPTFWFRATRRSLEAIYFLRFLTSNCLCFPSRSLYREELSRENRKSWSSERESWIFMKLASCVRQYSSDSYRRCYTPFTTVLTLIHFPRRALHATSRDKLSFSAGVKIYRPAFDES